MFGRGLMPVGAAPRLLELLAQTTHAGQRERRGCIQLVAGPPQVLPCRLCRARPEEVLQFAGSELQPTPMDGGSAAIRRERIAACARQSRNELYASTPPVTSA